MKKFIIIFGAFILFIFSFATLFKLLHWPGGNALFVVSMTLFCMIFIPIFFIERMLSNKKGLSIAVNVSGMISSNLIFIGIMFKIMHWPGAGPMIVLGTLAFLFVTLILYTIQQFKEYDRKFGEFWRLVVGAVLISVFLLFWSLQPSRNFLIDFLKIEDATLETNRNLKEYNEFILKSIKMDSIHSGSYVNIADNIHNKSQELIQYIENVKKILVEHIDPNPEAVNSHWYIISKEDSNVSSYYLGEGSEMGQELYRNLYLYTQELKGELQHLKLDTESIDEVTKGIKIEVSEEMKMMMLGGSENWSGLLFDHQVIVASLALLSGIQNEILNAEFKSLRSITQSKL